VRFIKLLVLLLFLLPASNIRSQEQSQDKAKFEVDLSEFQKEIDKLSTKPYSLGGFFEFQPVLFGIDRSSTFTRVRFYRDLPKPLADLYGLRLRLEGSYKKGIFSLFVKSDTSVRNELQGWNEESKLFEGYASVKPNENFIFEGGKKTMKWGKGYAWNPVAFLDRPKNPEDPEEALEGATLATADYIRSFDGALKTLTLTTALVPVYRHVNAKSGELGHVNFASKLYLLAYDTDFDWMVSTGSSRTTRYGFDFSKNLATNLEAHGEFAVVNNFKLTVVDDRGQISSRRWDAISYLLGMRYLTEKETTYIFEYYRNGTGLSREQMTDFYSFAQRSYRVFQNTGDDGGLKRAARLLDGAYGRPNPGLHYLYFRASQKEPFDILYFTPALTTILNARDGSAVVIPELSYSPMTNLELRLRAPTNIGKQRTDYGEKQNDFRIEFRIRFHFGL
jgi:hypothetical protein